MRLNLELRKGETVIFFTSPLKVSGEIQLRKAEIKWTAYNVGMNEKILTDDTEHDVLAGYYSFDDLKDFLESLNCAVTLEKSGKCSVTPPSGKSLNMKTVGRLLRFNKNQELTKKTESPYIVDVHGGLSRVEIFCDRINSYKNFLNGQRSEKLCQMLVPGGNLWGINSIHKFGDSLVPMERGEYSSIGFTVSDMGYFSDKDSYTVYLNIELM